MTKIRYMAVGPNGVLRRAGEDCSVSLSDAQKKAKDMTLRKQILIFIGITTLACIAVLYAATQVIIQGGITQLEVEQVRQEWGRVQNVLSDTLNQLGRLVKDWATADEACAFIRGAHPNYIRSNLSAHKLAALRIDLILFLDSSGRLVWGQAFDLKTHKKMPLPPSLKEHLMTHELLSRHADPYSHREGIILLPEGPLLIASRPIVASEGQGPIWGTLIMGRFFTPEVIQQLTRPSQVPLSWRRFFDPYSPADFQTAYAQLTKASPFFVQPLSDRLLGGYIWMEDLYGTPWVVRIEAPRVHYPKSSTMIQYAGLTVFVVSLVFGIVNLGWLGRLVLARVARLSEEVRQMGTQGHLYGRVSVCGKDELSFLALSINQMLEKLEWAQQDRQKAENRYRLLVEHMPAVTYIAELDEHRSIRYISPQIEPLLGFSEQEWKMDPRIWIQQLHPEDREKVLDQWAYSRLHNKPFRAHYRLRRKDGQVVWVQDEAELLQQPGSMALSLQGIIMDITAAKQSEQSLLQQMKRISLLNQIARAIAQWHDLDSLFQVVLHCLEDQLRIDSGAVWLLEPTIENLRMFAFKTKCPKMAERLGWRLGTEMPIASSGLLPCLKGETLYILDTDRAEALLPKSLAQQGIRSLVAIPLTADSEVFGVLVVARRQVEGFSNEESEFLRSLGDHVAVAASQARLHRELQQAYHDLRQTQQTVMQQERLRALGQMASGIAHDINNSLSPIVGFTDLLEGRETQLSEQGRRYLGYIKTAGQDIAHTVARMREFYRPRGQEMRQPVCLASLVQQVLDLTRPRWRDIPQNQGRVVEIQTDFEPDLPPVWGLESEIREALVNLIFNAIDALPEGGNITVRTYRKGSSPALSWGVLEVSDNGTGMDEETRLRCMEPFYSTKGERGTGLGLAMVYGVMQRHEGQIEIESEVGRGTTVRLAFPFRSSSLSEASAGPEERKPYMPQRVLFIDDEPLIRELVRDLLESEGHQVEVVEEGASGLQAFRAAQERGQPYGVVITDLGMPGVDGREVAREVKTISATTPVILLTGWGTWLQGEGRLRRYVDIILSKPPTLEALRQALEKVTTSSLTV